MKCLENVVENPAISCHFLASKNINITTHSRQTLVAHNMTYKKIKEYSHQLWFLQQLKSLENTEMKTYLKYYYSLVNKSGKM
jgi:hypothetical protein